ncbi:hypothetical protein QM012_003166 [Aureobasidium pullulans]|uniref:Translation initiation factor eIF2B subunit alpha n=1 Tax=Aureobasidium pullulans TaxID=5580 RepID=A0ABR0T9G7_AURPU
MTDQDEQQRPVLSSEQIQATDSLAEASLGAAIEQKQSQPRVRVQLEYQDSHIDSRLDPRAPVDSSNLPPPSRPSVLRLSLLDSFYVDNMVPANKQQNFDVVDTYKRLLADDPELTMPVAAIEALVLALAHTPATTVSETLDLLSTLTAELKARIPNPISLSAGTDLFQRYIITTLQKPSAGRNSDFDTIRTHLVQNGRLFVERAKEARDKIAGFGRHFVRDGNTVLTNGGSRVVGALLRSAAETSAGFGAQGSIRFRVIYVVSDSSDAESRDNIAQLRKLGIPVATIPPTAIAYSLNQVSQCFVGAEGVVENGGIISRLGTYQIAMLAKAANKPFYVVSESHKFVRLYPLGQTDLGIDQNIVEFKTTGDATSTSGSVSAKDEGVADMDVHSDAGVSDSVANTDAVDFTPPNLISGIITESGVLLPSAVSEELIKIWF